MKMFCVCGLPLLPEVSLFDSLAPKQPEEPRSSDVCSVCLALAGRRLVPDLLLTFKVNYSLAFMPFFL